MKMAATTVEVAVILMGLALVARAGAPEPTEAAPDEPVKADSQKLAQGCNALAADLYARLAAAKEGNLFFSPASIDTALAMTWAGAKGRTADQMAATLHYDLPRDRLSDAFARLVTSLNTPGQATEYEFPPDGGQPKPVKKPAYQLSVANALWGQKGYAFVPEFLGLLKKSYRAGLEQVEFAQPDAARKTINDWVSDQTREKIKDLIPPGALTPDTRLVLTNAIYFKSNWQDKFVKELTRDEDFKLSADKTAKVPMMHKQHRFAYGENEQVQMLSLPYKLGDLDMVVLLPKKADGLADVEKSIQAGKLNGWLAAMRHEEVELSLPKFKFAAEFALADTLKAMGMTDAFDMDKADFSGMATHEKLCISEVIHKAFVAVDEEGTEAAAATAVMMVGTAMPVEPEHPKVFRADHPFIFLIRHRATGTILFMGRVADPRGS